MGEYFISFYLMMLSLNISSFTSLLVSMLTIQVTAGRDITCDECLTVVGGLKDALLYNESLASEEEYILTEICPGAGLGDEDAHPNCEKFTAHHWPDLAAALFPAIIKADSFCSDNLGACYYTAKKDGEVSCDACKEVSDQVGGLLGDEEIIVDMVNWIISEFCVSGVPEQDTDFCMEYSRIVLPSALPNFSNEVIMRKEEACRNLFNTCM